VAGRERAVTAADRPRGPAERPGGRPDAARSAAPAAHAEAVRRAAVLGSPIAHSLSPVLHRAAYADLGLGWRYDAIEVTEADLGAFVAGCGPEWAGLSLTMPLKRAILPLLDSRAPLVDVVGAANTVVFGPHGRLDGHNTDVWGMVVALRGLGAPAGPALVLGGGATAASALAALAEMGCQEVRLLARRPAFAEQALSGVAARLAVQLAVARWPLPGDQLPDRSTAGVVVSTAPAAAAASLEPAVPRHPGVLLDVSYDPWPPRLVRAWRRAGGLAVAGDEMLLHQAAAQVELMTGRSPSVDVMRAALQAALRDRG
jgi:shikimate 5-dehydrogenase